MPEKADHQHSNDANAVVHCHRQLSQESPLNKVEMTRKILLHFTLALATSSVSVSIKATGEDPNVEVMPPLRRSHSIFAFAIDRKLVSRGAIF